MAGSQVATGISIINSLSGFFSLSLTNFDNDSLPAIAAGSKVEVAGAFFTFNAETAIDSTHWAGIGLGYMAYIMLTPSGTPGSQTLSASWTSAAPTWVDSKQGWYASAASSVRCIGGVYKYDATNYSAKFLLNNRETTKNRYINIGSWNMKNTLILDITHKPPTFYLTGVNAIIRHDATDGTQRISPYDSNYVNVSSSYSTLGIIVSSTYIRLISDNTYFSQSGFESTSINRGYVAYTYRVI